MNFSQSRPLLLHFQYTKSNSYSNWIFFKCYLYHSYFAFILNINIYYNYFSTKNPVVVNYCLNTWAQIFLRLFLDKFASTVSLFMTIYTENKFVAGCSDIFIKISDYLGRYLRLSNNHYHLIYEQTSNGERLSNRYDHSTIKLIVHIFSWGIEFLHCVFHLSVLRPFRKRFSYEYLKLKRKAGIQTLTRLQNFHFVWILNVGRDYWLILGELKRRRYENFVKKRDRREKNE